MESLIHFYSWRGLQEWKMPVKLGKLELLALWCHILYPFKSLIECRSFIIFKQYKRKTKNKQSNPVILMIQCVRSPLLNYFSVSTKLCWSLSSDVGQWQLVHGRLPVLSPSFLSVCSGTQQRCKFLGVLPAFLPALALFVFHLLFFFFLQIHCGWMKLEWRLFDQRRNTKSIL